MLYVADSSSASELTMACVQTIHSDVLELVRYTYIAFVIVLDTFVDQKIFLS